MREEPSPNSKIWDEIASTVSFSAPVDLSCLRKEVSTDERILDLGCGYGRITATLKNSGFTKVVGYDSSDALVKRGRAECPGLDLKTADACNIPEPDAAFRVVITAGLFTSIPESDQRIAVLREIRRLLAGRGLVVGVDFHRNERVDYVSDGRFKSSSGIEMKHFFPAELREFFSDFPLWEHRIVPASSLTGAAIDAIQYVARRLN